MKEDPCPTGKRLICADPITPPGLIDMTSPFTTDTLLTIIEKAYNDGKPLGYDLPGVPRPSLAPSDSSVETPLVPPTDPNWLKNYSFAPAKPAALIKSFLERWKLTEIINLPQNPLHVVEKIIESFRTQAMAELSPASAAYLSRVVDTLKKPLWLMLPSVDSTPTTPATPTKVVDVMLALNFLYVFARVFDSFGEIISEENAAVVASYMTSCFWGQVTQRRLSFKNEETGKTEFVWSNPMTYLDWYIGEGIIWCDTVKQALENVNKGTEKIVKGAKDLMKNRMVQTVILIVLLLLLALTILDTLGAPCMSELPGAFYKFIDWVKSVLR